jgi:hypothetical protein
MADSNALSYWEETMLSDNPKVINDALEIRKKHPARKVIVPEIRIEDHKSPAFRQSFEAIDAMFREIPPGGLTFYAPGMSGKTVRVTLEELP